MTPRTPRVGGIVTTRDGPGEYMGTVRPHGMALVRFPDGTSALYRTEEVYVVGVAGVIKAKDLVVAQVAHMLSLPSSEREGGDR